MLNRVLEIAEENRYVSLYRGFIVIKCKNEELGRVPLDDVAVLLLSAQSVTLSKNVVNALAESGGVTVFCGNNYTPLSMALPVGTHTYFAKIIKAQINLSEPFKKRIWQEIVIQKIKNQSLALRYTGKEEDAAFIEKISKTVKSGDTDNREAYAAKMYWKALFGNSFIRDKDGSGVNAFLNYGYAVMRAGMARAICAHGLLASLGVHHDNNLNPFCLADDFFEIYRPMVDVMVYKMHEAKEAELNPQNKQKLVNLLKMKVNTVKGESQAVQSMHYLASSYVNAMEKGKAELEMPDWEGNADGITLIE